MYVRFWGTRGSIPTPGSQTVQFGGNTSCVEVRAADGTLIIFDCGTGIRDLGIELLRSPQRPKCIYLLIGHTHWDHIQGFPFFTPAFLPDVELHIFAPSGFERGLEDAISGQMQYSYFPVKLQDLASRIYYREVEEGFFRIGDVLIETQYLNHTAPTVAYRVTDGEATMVYVTDHEPFWNTSDPIFLHPGDQHHVEFLRGADLVVHDAQYTAEEYKSRIGWGHSPIEYATDVAVAANVRRLALFHHDPSHSDLTIALLEETARQRAASYGSTVEIFCAAEGSDLRIRGTEAVSKPSGLSALERRSNAGSRILVLMESQTGAAKIKTVLDGDRYVITTVTEITNALGMILDVSPDLVIMSASFSADVTTQVELLRSASGKPELPVLLLTDIGEDNQRLAAVQGVATDYIAKSFSPPMLRSRVRAWLARTSSTRRPGDERPDLETTRASAAADSVLASCPLFESFSEVDLAKLREASAVQTYPTGHAIVRQGDYSDSVYVVLSGRVRVVEGITDPALQTVLGEFGPGEVFGELGVLLQQPRSATVFAMEPAQCMKISQKDFASVLQNSPEMRKALHWILSDRLHATNLLLARHAPDPLTGLPSRRAFHDVYRRLSANVRRRGGSVLLLAVDIVGLKAINGRWGYGAGDDVLRVVASTLLEFSTKADLVARYAGDEFAALLIDADIKDAEALISRFKSQLQVRAQGLLPVPITCSIGYAVSQAPPETADEMLRQADSDMQAKRARQALENAT